MTGGVNVLQESLHVVNHKQPMQYSITLDLKFKLHHWEWEYIAIRVQVKTKTKPSSGKFKGEVTY